MADQYQMSPVVRRIDSAGRRNARTTGLVVTLGEGWFTTKSHYHVVTPVDGAGVTTCRLDAVVEAPERNLMLQLTAALTVQFAGGGEPQARRLVEAIHAADNPDKAVQMHVRTWIAEFVDREARTPARFVDGYFSHCEELKAEIVKRAATELALKVTKIDLKIRGEDAVANVLELPSSHVPVILSDYKPEVSLVLDVHLEKQPGSILPYLATDPEGAIGRDLRQGLRDVFRTGMRLHDWQYAVERVQERAATVVDEVAQRHGRKAVRLMVSRTGAFDRVPREFETKFLKEQFKQLDYPDPVEVDVDLKMRLTDLGQMVASGIDPDQIHAWARTTAREAIGRQLLDVNYIDLFPQFDEKEAATRAYVEAAAKRIGYTVSRFIIQTNLDFHVLQRGFVCRIENARFPLKLRECEVALDVETYLRITDREELLKLFKKNTGITQTVETAIRGAVESQLRQVSPEEFYLRFYGAGGLDGVPAAPGPTVADKLEEAVRKACAVFKPDADMTVHFAQQPDELMGVYRHLVRSEILLDGLEDPNTGLCVDVKAAVDSISVTHWAQFQERRPTLDQIGAELSQHVLSFLNEAAHANFTRLVNTPGTQIARSVEKWINERLVRSYGVGVHIAHWYLRDATFAAPETSWEKQIQDRTEAVNELSAQLKRAYLEDEPEVAGKLEKRIAHVREGLTKLFQQRGAPGTLFIPADPQFEMLLPAAAPKAIAPASSVPANDAVHAPSNGDGHDH